MVCNEQEFNVHFRKIVTKINSVVSEKKYVDERPKEKRGIKIVQLFAACRVHDS
jgi:hypothetical protein